ncbi:hypothetical protein [Haliscomenobacter sp.]|uniref:hypothetical protein n=1 Tax=Haliscomenobacter sp. TaxID=2717303 RepID=UPI003364C62D
MPQYKGRWQSSLAEQINDLPAFERAEREVQRHLEIWECSQKKTASLDNLIWFFSGSFKRLAVNFNCDKVRDMGKSVAVILVFLPTEKMKNYNEPVAGF